MTTDRSFGEALHQLATDEPDRTALTCGDASMTRGVLDARTNRLARIFSDRGVEPGSYVTIGLPNGIAWVEAAVATWKLGAIPQPVSPRLPPREIAAILELVRPAVVVGLDLPGAVPGSFEPPMDVSSAPLTFAVSPAWKAATSGGSTGRPKVIVATQPALLSMVEPFGDLLGLPVGGTILTTGPLDHNAPFLTTALALLRGAHVVLMPRFDAVTALELAARHRVQWMYAVPTMMLRIWRLPEADRNRHDLSGLERVFHMAAPCPQWLKREWISWLGPDRVWELYGGTEVQAVTVLDGNEWLAHPGSVGRPVIGEIAVLDDAGSAEAPGTVGPLWMRRGAGEPPPYRYLGATARSRDGGWECLGDVGRLDEDGYVYLVDRDSDLILVGGSNVFPAEVEAILEEHPAVRTSCAVGVADDDLGQVVHAVVEVASEVTDEELLAFCLARLVRYKVPRVLHRSTTPLRDEAGKVRRSAIRDMLTSARAGGDAP